ncbi:unnamed protein product, partial [Didymodactylos carnosus]
CETSIFCKKKKPKLFDNYLLLENTVDTLCSERATRRGYHQNIIGVSAYISLIDSVELINSIWKYLLIYLEEVRLKYPKWIVRVYYHNINVSLADIKNIENLYKNVDFCDVQNIPVLGNIVNYMPGKIQRFLPLADKFVDYYMSRDIDSPIFDREVSAVNEWIASDKMFHIMRDHPQHDTAILGGLWGIKKFEIPCYNRKGDQQFLEKYIWPLIRTNSLQHDSFLCRRFPTAEPFPT